MRWIRNDTMALACILGSAAAGGATTVALLDARGPVDHHCVVEQAPLSSTVVVRRATPKVIVGEMGATSRVITGVRAPHVVVTRQTNTPRTTRCSVGIGEEIQDMVVDLKEMETIHVDLSELEHLEVELKELEAELQEKIGGRGSF